MTRTAITTALANIGINIYRVTDNAAHFRSSDGRKAKVTAWTDDADIDATVRDVRSQIETDVIPVQPRMDVNLKTGRHIDRAPEQARAKARAERKRQRKAVQGIAP